MVSKALKGSRELRAKLDNIPKESRQNIANAINKNIIKIDEEIKNSVQQRRSSGRTYGNHVASLPGFPPNTDTGELVNSVFINQATRQKLKGRTGASAPYTKDLEFGTRRMSPRPFIQPAFDKFKERAKKDIFNAVGDTLDT